MSDQKSQQKDPYRDTLHLPKTDFPMKAGLLEAEPKFQKKWLDMGLYTSLRSQNHAKGRFLFHDGPPYANGSIHLGHLLNKVLKDLVVRTKTMDGYDVDYIPGWDCHGLPIEHKVLKELGPKARELTKSQVREKCHDYAAGFVKLQADQMIRLGTLANYSKPYLTMNPAYEGAVLEVFSDLVAAGLVKRALKPVHWSIANRTALAEAELEYEEREDQSVYTLFEVDTSSSQIPAELHSAKGEPLYLMIWTTTPWTLPANRAIAVAPKGKYGLYRVTKEGRSIQVVVVEALAEKVFDAKRGVEKHELLGVCLGEELTQVKYRHPFVSYAGPVVTAEYVTFEDGTGLVHTAPGHGTEDYETGKRENLEIYCPVLEDGKYDDTAPEWLKGKSVWDGNQLVIDRLKESGDLFFHHKFKHSYPHDWRSKTPTIYRATHQWFVLVDHAYGPGKKTLRQAALQAAQKDIAFYPDWGRNRLTGMLESRPDWCISRQRAWGLPIPAFTHTNGESLLTPESVKAVAKVIRAKGSSFWFDATPQDLLSGYDPSKDTLAPAWSKQDWKKVLSQLEKSHDIFDVWFESGSSWNAVLRERGMGYPADLYLEGSDQHRGWFQLSLLPALGATGVAPFKALLTHGFMVDGKGKKMGKSLGNSVEVDDLLKQYGADICRWWVASLNYANDIKVDWNYFKVAGEEYRKIRNTMRFLLGNIFDFDPAKNTHVWKDEDRTSIDAWALSEFQKMQSAVLEAYREFDFKRAQESLFHFCNETLSAIYLATCKDRLYCEATNSVKRRRTQTVLHEMANGMIRLLAPILVHTADEAFGYLHGKPPEGFPSSIHLEKFRESKEGLAHPDWSRVFELRNLALKQMELTKEKGLTNQMDMGVLAKMGKEDFDRIQPFKDDLADLCGVSRFRSEKATQPGIEIEIEDLREQPRCQRSWKRDGTVRQRSDGGMLTDRDAGALGV